MSKNRLMRFFFAAFRPPFKGLAWIVWAYFVWCFLIHPQTAILHGAFSDSDDVIHLVRAMEWARGAQDWFDPLLHRLSPPEGVAIHFSRLAELPLAGVMLPLHALGAGWIAAAYVSAFVWPLVLLAFLFGALRRLAESFVPKEWSRASAYVALFTAPVIFQFSPGRVDHHGLAALLTVAAFACVAKLVWKPENVKAALGGGFFLALGLAVSLETLPWLLLFGAWMGFWVMIEGRRAALAATFFGLSLYVFAALFLAATVARADFYALSPLHYSFLYVLLAGGVALGLVVVSLAALLPRVWPRVATALGIAFFALAALWLRAPAFFMGPYAGMDHALAALMMNHISEALPLLAKPPGTIALYALVPLLALSVSLRLMVAAVEAERVFCWLLQSLLLIAAIFLMAAYQVRVALYAHLFSVVPLLALLRDDLARARRTLRGRKLFAMEAFAILLVGPLLGVIGPALADGRSFNKGVLLFPVAVTADKTCAPDGLWQVLTLPGSYGDRPRLIMNTANEGALILFHTPHKALAAPYHTNVSGNLDSFAFFRATDPAAAEKIVRRRGAEMVLLCADLPSIYKSDETVATLSQDGAELLSPHATFAEQLVSGKVPPWLKRVEMPFLGQALLFEVRP